MNKLNYRFFYYKTRASYEKDSMYDRIPEDAIIFIKDDCIIAQGSEFGKKQTFDFSSMTDTEKESLVQSIAEMLTGDSNDGLVTKEDLQRMLTDAIGGTDREHLIETIKEILTDTDAEDVGGKTVIESIVEKVVEQLTDVGGQNAFATKEYVDNAVAGITGFDPNNAEQVAALESVIKTLLGEKGDDSLTQEIIEQLTTVQEGEVNKFIENIVNDIFSEDVIANLTEEEKERLKETLDVCTKSEISELLGEYVKKSEIEGSDGSLTIQVNDNTKTLDITKIDKQ